MTHVRFVGNIKRIFTATFVAVFATLILLVANGYKQVRAAADTCTWTGSGADSNISTAGNWTGCDNSTVPEDGDTLIFPNGPTNKTVTVDSDMGFNSITLSGSGYTVASATFESLGVYSSLTISGNNNVFNGYVRLYPSTTATVNHSGTGTSFAHYLVTQPFAANTDVIFNLATDLSIPMLSQTAVNGSSSVDTVTKTGVGVLDITGTAISGMTASGGIFIEEGRWTCDSINCLGDASNEIILAEGGNTNPSELYLNYDGTLPNPITVDAVVEGYGYGDITASGDVTFSGNFTLHGITNFFVEDNSTMTIDGNVAMDDGASMAINGRGGYSSSVADFNGIISGNAKVIIIDTHATLSGNNTYTGDTEIYNDGNGGAVITVKDNNSLGNSGAGTIVNSGTTLEFDNSSSTFYDEPLTVEGDGVGGSYLGALVNADKYAGLRGGLTLTDDTTVRNNSTTEYIGLLSQITGDYDLTLSSENSGIGFVFQSSGATNSYKDLIVNGSYLDIFPDNGDLVIPNNLTLNAANGLTSLIVMERDNTIADDAVITLNNDTSQEAVLLNNGVEDTVGTIAGDGTVTISDSDGQFLLGGGNTSGTFSGTINGYANSQIDITGGTWTFTGTNADVGNGFESYYVNGGTMLANAENSSLGSSPFSISAGVIGGDSTIGPISVYSGTVAPGNSPGCLSVNGDVAFADSSSAYQAQLQDGTVCTGYDQLNATGTIYLNGTTLSIELLSDFSADYGQEFTILQANSIDGTFTGLSDGEAINIGDHPFRINYNATTVTLTYTGRSTSSSSIDLAKTGISILSIITIASGLIASSIFILKKRVKTKVQL